jgi:hypothetical protein
VYLEERRLQYRASWQEQFSLAYIHAIAATAGVTCQKTGEDIDGIDVQLGADGSKGAIRFPKLEAQLKSWTKPVEQDGRFRYPLKVRNYEHLRIPNDQLGLPRILVLVTMPIASSDWFRMTHEAGMLRHCAYWASLAGMPPSKNTAEVTIEVPKENQFSVQALEAGPRRSVVMSDSSEGDPEVGDGSGGVASVVAEGSGEVDGPARLSTPIARLRRRAMVCGPVPVRPGKRPR